MSGGEPALHDQVGSLYSDHHGWLLAWLRGKLGCGHNAADVAQDTFMRILSSRDALRDMRNPRAYLTTTARRLIIDRARREAIERTYLAELAILAEDADGHASPEQLWQAIEALEEISRVLERVSRRARQAFLLHYLDGESQSEVAVKLGVTTRTVRNDLVQVLVSCQQITSS
ncbi:MAG: sigma-70 family RNA polymerase sigma factor [Porticoccaceae bacterium]